VNKAVKTVVFWAVIVISAMLLFQVVKAKPAEQSTPQISYSQFMAAVESGDVVKVTIAGNRIRGQYRNNGVFWLFGPANQSLFLDLLRDKGVEAKRSLCDSPPDHDSQEASATLVQGRRGRQLAFATAGNLGSHAAAWRSLVFHDPANAAESC
jgi:ATP-dependent Zn protease